MSGKNSQKTILEKTLRLLPPFREGAFHVRNLIHGRPLLLLRGSELLENLKNSVDLRIPSEERLAAPGMIATSITRSAKITQIIGIWRDINDFGRPTQSHKSSPPVRREQVESP